LFAAELVFAVGVFAGMAAGLVTLRPSLASKLEVVGWLDLLVCDGHGHDLGRLSPAFYLSKTTWSPGGPRCGLSDMPSFRRVLDLMWIMPNEHSGVEWLLQVKQKFDVDDGS
jgi:hypothetical protein